MSFRKLEFPVYDQPPLKYYFPGWAAWQRALWWLIVFAAIGFAFLTIFSMWVWPSVVVIALALALWIFDSVMAKRHPYQDRP